MSFSYQIKDRQQERTAVSSRSHLIALCTFATPAIHEYYISLKSQLNALSIDINTMEIILSSIMWQCGELKKIDILPKILNMDISLNNQHKLLKFWLCALQYHIKRTVSQIFYLGPTCHFMKFRK